MYYLTNEVLKITTYIFKYLNILKQNKNNLILIK